MASADVRDELTCTICTDIYTDPVTLPCGHNYCQHCIKRTWDCQEDGESSCPVCRQRYRRKPELKRNLTLCNLAESVKDSSEPLPKIVLISCDYCDSPAAKTCLHCEASLCDKHLKKHSKSEEHVLVEPTASFENRKCSVHKEILKFYCCEDAAYICVICRLDGDHKGHQVETLNEASEKKKETLRNNLQDLTSQREEDEKSVQNLEEQMRQVQGKAAGTTEGVTALIRDIREQLDALEKRVLSEISRQKEQVSLRASELIRQLEIKKEELSTKMGNIEKLCDMTDPLTVLQESDRADYDYDRGRPDRKVHDVGDLDVGLIWDTLHNGLSSFVTSISRHVRETGNNLTISSNRNILSWSEWSLKQTETAERFLFSHISSKIAYSGQASWEVESKLGDFSVGMAYPSKGMDGCQLNVPYYERYWCLRKWNLHQYRVVDNDGETTLPQSPSSNRVGMFLDYKAGRLSFCELCEPMRHLHTFTVAFTEPLNVFFFSWGDSTFK